MDKILKFFITEWKGILWNKDQIDYVGRSKTCLEDYVNSKGISVIAQID